MAQKHSAPEEPVRVLAIASHVTYGYVGNKMASYVMQVMGCDVSAIDTVHFSNHTAYGQWTGAVTAAEEVQQLYEGLKRNDLPDFDMMLSGYAASKEVVAAVGKIGRDQRYRSSLKPGVFFWILDPVMGDQGKLYVAADIVPAYRALLPHADLILPNAFEAEQLAEMEITDMKSIAAAITKLHQTYQVPHVVITSVRLDGQSQKLGAGGDRLVVVGSSCRSDFTPRIFTVDVPGIPVFFSGTGDMFAALTLCRLRETVSEFDMASDAKQGDDNTKTSLLTTKSWMPPDSVPATELPLAKSTERTLASMHTILTHTARDRDAALRKLCIGEEEPGEERDKAQHTQRVKASEVRVVKYAKELREPSVIDGVRFEAKEFAET